MSNLNEDLVKAAKKVIDIFHCGEHVSCENYGPHSTKPNSTILNEPQEQILQSVKDTINGKKSPSNWEGPVLEKMLFDAIKDLEKAMNA